MQIEIEFDLQKANNNYQKHQVRFEYAVHVLADPKCIIQEDIRHAYGEIRYVALGKAVEDILVMVYTHRQDRIRIISARKANEKERKTTMRITLDLNNPKRMPSAERQAFDAINEKDIDYSDIPELSEDWLRAVNPLSLPIKKQISLRLDTDIIEWFKSQGSRYQTRINQVLRSYKEAHTPKRKSAST